MTRFTKIAVMIALGLQSLNAMPALEQSDTLTKDQFTSLVESIPDHNVRDNVAMLYEDKNYYELESSLREFIGEYLENSSSAQDRSMIEDKKEAVMVKNGNFIADEARESEEANLEDEEDFLGDFLNGLLESSNKLQKESTEDVESSFKDSYEDYFEDEEPMAVEAARQIVQEAIDSLDDDKKTEVNSIFTEKKYEDLEELLMTYISLENVDEIKLIDALETLEIEADILSETFEDSFEDEPLTVEAARQIVQEAIDSLDDDKKTEANSLFTEKKYEDLEELLMTHIDLENVDDTKLIDALETLEIEADILSEAFEDSPNEMSQDPVSVEDAKEIVQKAIDSINDDKKTEANSLFAEEKYDDLEKFFLNNTGLELNVNAEELFDAFDKLLEAGNDAPPETSFETTAMTVTQARQAISNFINKYMSGDSKTKATNILNEENYDDLEDTILTNLEMEQVTDEDFKHFADAMMVLTEEMEEPAGDEIDEEKELSELKASLAETQEGLKKLLSRINGV